MGPCWRERLRVKGEAWVEASLCAAYRSEKQPLWLATIQLDQDSVREYFFALSDVACRKCGCRMVTKVGRSHPMLICSDCGLPVDDRQTSQLARQRLWGALTLVTMAFVSFAMLLLATLYEWRTAGALKDGGEQRGESSGEKEERREERALLEPSGLMGLLERPGVTEAERRAPHPKAGARTVSVSAKPPATETPQDQEQDPKPQHQR